MKDAPDWLENAWLDDVASHDYEAADSFLSLYFSPLESDRLMQYFKTAPLISHRVNDILRASGLPALTVEDAGVNRDFRKLVSGKKLSPVLLVSNRSGCLIADGYHRISLVFNGDPFATIPCKVAVFNFS